LEKLWAKHTKNITVPSSTNMRVVLMQAVTTFILVPSETFFLAILYLIFCKIKKYWAETKENTAYLALMTEKWKKKIRKTVLLLHNLSHKRGA
jgi:hypothetical protein